MSFPNILAQGILHLTAEHQSVNLPTLLTSTLSKFIANNDINYIELNRGRSFAKFSAPDLKHEELIDPVYHVRPRPEVLQAITLFLERRERGVTNVEGKTLFPILSRNTLFGFIILTGPNISQENLADITLYLKIYANLYATLDASERDTLTGLYNRKTFESRINTSLLTNGSHLQTFLGILDIDLFKHVNDDYGHIFGDEILLLVARLLEQNLKGNDLIFRYGGEEFVLVLSCETSTHAMTTFDRLRVIIDQYDFPSIHHVTTSIGYTGLDSKQHLSTSVDQADKGLYYAKQHGRNQTHCYESLMRQKKIQATNEQVNVVDLW